VECVEMLADQPELRAEFGRSARAFVAEQFARDTLAEKMLQRLSEVAGTAGDAAGTAPTVSVGPESGAEIVRSA
jgi:hypothetical protein